MRIVGWIKPTMGPLFSRYSDYFHGTAGSGIHSVVRFVWLVWFHCFEILNVARCFGFLKEFALILCFVKLVFFQSTAYGQLWRLKVSSCLIRVARFHGVSTTSVTFLWEGFPWCLRGQDRVIMSGMSRQPLRNPSKVKGTGKNTYRRPGFEPAVTTLLWHMIEVDAL